MLNTIDRYLLRQILATCLVMTGIGLAVLLLERVLHLFGLVSNANKAFSYVGQMLLLLLPHYLSIALPAAFFFGVLLTFGRLQRDGEMVVMMSAGRGLARLLAPVVGLAVILTVLAALIVGVIGPHAHYAYRSLKHTVAQASLTAAVLDGTFVHADGLTFFAERTDVGEAGLQLSQVFVHEEDENGATIVVTGRHGVLVPGAENDPPVLVLEEGVRAEIAADGSTSDTLTFTDLSWPVASEQEPYRSRGRDQNELTLRELWTAQPEATPTSKPSAAEIAAELHGRLVLIASVPVLPLLAAPLALVGQVRSRRADVVVGLVILVVYHETLNFGEAMAKRDLLDPAIGLWLPFAVLAAGTAFVFARVLAGRPLIPAMARRRAAA